MKNSILLAICLLSMATALTSCEAIAGIFKAGMSVGAFAVIAVILLAIFLISRLFKSKN